MPALFRLGIVLCFTAASMAQGRPPQTKKAKKPPKTHTVVLGKWSMVRLEQKKGPDKRVRVRPLLVDDRLKEYAAGLTHDVTDQMFVVRRAYRINDSLPQEAAKLAHWKWHLGPWISVNRQTGHVAELKLPAFDVDSSEATWFQDYVAYCGMSDDRGKNFMVIFRLGKRKPLLQADVGNQYCGPPAWQRNPVRAIFTPFGGEAVSFRVEESGEEP